MLAMLTSLSTTLLIAYFHGTLSIGALCGVLVAFLGFLSYTSSNNRTGQVEPERNASASSPTQCNSCSLTLSAVYHSRSYVLHINTVNLYRCGAVARRGSSAKHNRLFCLCPTAPIQPFVCTWTTGSCLCLARYGVYSTSL